MCGAPDLQISAPGPGTQIYSNVERYKLCKQHQQQLPMSF